MGAFLTWLEAQRVASIAGASPLHVEQLTWSEQSAPIVKQQLAAIRRLFDWLRLVRAVMRVRVFDPTPDAVSAFARDPSCADLDVHQAASLEEAMEGADIVVAATWAREPFLFRHHLRQGLHVTTLGPDQPGKCEVAADALEAARVIVDDRRLAVEMGAAGGAGLGEPAISAELGEVLAGVREGRLDAGEITVFGSVGLAFQDLAAGWLAYSLARERGIGRSLDLLG